MALTLGWTTGELDLQLNPAADFVDQIELRVGNTPTSWPVGTTAWLRLSARGTSFDVTWPATVVGSALQWSVPAVQVAQVPRGTWAELWLQYPGGPPIPWLEGKVGSGCRTAAFGYVVAVPGIGAGAVAVPVPGPPGPPGDAASAGVTLTGVAAVTLSGHAAVHRNPDGSFEYASSTAAEHLSVPIGVTTGAVSSGGSATVLMLGELTESSWSWTPGAPVFLGAGGALVQVLPGNALFLAVIGTAISPTTLYVDRQPSIELMI